MPELNEAIHEDSATVADYLRLMARDTGLLLSLAQAGMCGDVAAILLGRAQMLEHSTEQTITEIPMLMIDKNTLPQHLSPASY